MSRDGPYDDRFAPERWSAFLDAAPDEPAGYLFRRGLELARTVGDRLARAGELWLDVGCGPGHLTANLAARGVRVLGADHDAAMLRLARRRFHRRESPFPAFVLAPAQRLPIADGAAHGVMAVSLMGCLTDPMPFLHEVHRVLRRNGWLIFTVTHRSSLLRRCEHAIALAWPGVRGSGGDVVRPYGTAEIHRFLERTGITLVRIQGYGLHLQLGTTVVPGIATSRALDGRGGSAVARVLARNLLVVARKR